MHPSDLMKISGDYWSACALHAAVKLDIFTPIVQGTEDPAELAKATGCSLRGLTMLLNAITAMGLLDVHEGHYVAPPFTATFLSKLSDQYLGHIIMHHHHLVSGWARLDEAVKSGQPLKSPLSRINDETLQQSFLMGMFNLASLAAPKVIPSVNLAGRRTLLDLGGGPGTYAIHFCLHNPGLQAVVYDLPTTRRFAEETIKRYTLTDRISFCGGDIISDDIGSGYDAVWISHLLHSEGPEEAEIMVRKAVNALTPGGLVMVQEFILDDNHAHPVFPALFSLNMLLGTQAGQSYSQAELTGMLTRAGIKDISRIPIELPNGAGILIGISD